MTELKLETGLEEIRFCDGQGNPLGTVWFNPADMGIAERAGEAAEELERNWAERDLNSPEAVAALEKEVCGLFDRVFACPFSETVFARISPLALTADGRCFYETVLDALLPVMEASIRAKAEKSHERLRKYLG